MKPFHTLVLASALIGTGAAFAADPAPVPPAPTHSTTNAPAAPRKAVRTLTDDQKALLKEITAKYDTNKDGRLSPEERAKISDEDKAKLQKAGLGPRAVKPKSSSKKASPRKRS